MHWFSLAGDGKTNKGIRQRLRWLMHMPYGMCDDIFDSPKRQKTAVSTARQLSSTLFQYREADYDSGKEDTVKEPYAQEGCLSRSITPPRG